MVLCAIGFAQGCDEGEDYTDTETADRQADAEDLLREEYEAEAARELSRDADDPAKNPPMRSVGLCQ